MFTFISLYLLHFSMISYALSKDIRVTLSVPHTLLHWHHRR